MILYHILKQTTTKQLGFCSIFWENIIYNNSTLSAFHIEDTIAVMYSIPHGAIIRLGNLS